MATARVDCYSHDKIASALPGSSEIVNATLRFAYDRRVIRELNPTLRGWGEYYKRAHVRTLFHRLDRWIVRRIWSHRFRRWRTLGWKQLPPGTLYAELGLVNLFLLIPSLAPRPQAPTS